MKIATLITCHNRKSKTLACLGALYKNSLPESCLLDVFLVDDGSVDGTSSVVRANYPQVNIITGDGNLYWNRGMHKAWNAAASNYDYDYYLWLNDDTLIFDSGLENLINQAKDKSDTAIIVAATCSRESLELTYSGFDRKGKQVSPNGKDCQQLFAINGNCVLIPKRVFKAVGNLDPLFHHAMGDHDYSYRALSKGFESYLSSDYLAFCEKNNAPQKWCSKSVSIISRLKILYSPLSYAHPYQFYRYELRHFGNLVAIKHILSIHFKLLFPDVWKKIKELKL